MKIIHIMTYNKFTNSFIQFLNINFDSNNHLFFVYIPTKNYESQNYSNTHYISNRLSELLKLVKTMNISDKIILHSIFSNKIPILFFLQPWLLPKVFWVMWGDDLYSFLSPKRNIKSKFYEVLRASVIRRIGNFITQVSGDYELAKKWYSAKGQYYYSFMYPSNLYKDDSLISEKKTNEKINIQLGNSADPSNNHIEVLNKLGRYKDYDIEVICPLSYGNKDNAKQVINYGSKILGEKFIPITEFMPIDKYLEILNKVDVAIFNHKRQQAMGNITTLLGLGKKVYIRDEITTWQFCVDHDLKVYDVSGEFEDLFEKIDEEIRQKNIENVKLKFSEEKLIEDLNRIFNEEGVK